MYKKIVLISALIFILFGSFFYFYQKIYFSHGEEKAVILFEIKKGEGNSQIATDLVQKKIISGKLYFYYYLYASHLTNKIMPGIYMLSGNLTIGEIVQVITNPEAQTVKITFPEGLTSKEMADILKRNNFDGVGFLQIVNNIPDNFRTRYAFLANPEVKNLEGYLFPDTYFFKKEATAENIVKKMLDDFESRLNEQILIDVKKQNKTLRDIITMASIIEREVPDANDMKIVAGVFWNRIAGGMPLQSDATLSFILDDKTDSHSVEQTKINSPYNTYINKGLPPGPIDNPGMNAILATVYSQKTDYAYFLTSGTGANKKVYYAKTFQEHLDNKKKAGL